MSRWQRPIRIMVHVESKADLFQIVLAFEARSRCPRLLHGREQKPHQNREDGQNDKQLDEGKTLAEIRMAVRHMPKTVIFEIHSYPRLERFGVVNLDFDRAYGDASGRDEDLCTLLPTEAAIPPSAIGYAENAMRLVPRVTNAHFQHVRTKRLFAEIELLLFDEQSIVAIPILLRGENPKHAANKHDQGEEQADPGNLGHHRHTGS
jgi:hypothetical protein